MELKDKVIAITGGASGLGEASTRHFVSQGAKVMILDINDDNAKTICYELGDDHVKYVNTNIMEEQPVVRIYETTHLSTTCRAGFYCTRWI